MVQENYKAGWWEGPPCLAAWSLTEDGENGEQPDLAGGLHPLSWGWGRAPAPPALPWTTEPPSQPPHGSGRRTRATPPPGLPRFLRFQVIW